MTVSQVIRPGDKIDISLMQHMARSEDNGTIPRIYKSKVLDLKENGNLEIAMPSEGGRLVLLTLGVRFEFVFFSRGGLYRAIGQVVERYKRENVYMLEIELKSQLEKYQRREFFRYPCILDVSFYTITKEEAEMGTGDAIFIYLREEQEKNSKREYTGQILDLSGGGARFTTEKELSDGQYILFEIHLENESLDKQYYIVGNALSSTRTENRLYEVRAKFLLEDHNIREEIIRFIFEEERKARQRDRG